MNRYLRIGFLIVIFSPLVGCALTRTVYVPSGEPVKLAAPIKNQPIWVNVDGKPVKSKMDIPEGWYALEYKDENN